MKRKDINLIIVVAIISAFLSFILSGMFISSPKDRNQQVKIAKPISSEFQELPAQYFNEKALDPTQLIKIGQDANSKPFGSQ